MANQPYQNQQHRPQQQNRPQQEQPRSMVGEQPKPAAIPDVEEEPQRKWTPFQRFENKLLALLQGVAAYQLGPTDAVHELHRFWRQEFTQDERESIIYSESDESIQAVASRLANATALLTSEIPALLSAHLSSRGL